MALKKELQESIESLWVQKDELITATNNVFEQVIGGLDGQQRKTMKDKFFGGFQIEFDELTPLFYEAHGGLEPYTSEDLNWEDQYGIIGDIQYHFKE